MGNSPSAISFVVGKSRDNPKGFLPSAGTARHAGRGAEAAIPSPDPMTAGTVVVNVRLCLGAG